jgi:hypothetical protein
MFVEVAIVETEAFLEPRPRVAAPRRPLCVAVLLAPAAKIAAAAIVAIGRMMSQGRFT